jgi:hypothetical protein
LRRLYRGRIWYLDIICINGLANHEWLIMRPCKWNSFINEWRANKTIHSFLLWNVYAVRVSWVFHFLIRVPSRECADF